MARPRTGSLVPPAAARRSWGIRYRDPDGKRRNESNPDWSREDAQAQLNLRLAEVEAGTWTPRKKPAPANRQTSADSESEDFYEFAEGWYEDRLPSWREHSANDAKWALQHLVKHFGRMQPHEISARDVDDFKYAKQREGKLSNRSINKVLGYLSTILETAQDYGLVDRNVAHGKKRRLPTQTPERPVVESEQLPYLLDACGVHFRPIVAAMAGAGLRVSEACALKWSDVDLAAEQIHVRSGKTAAATRRVDLPVGLRDELREYRALRGVVGNVSVFRKQQTTEAQTPRSVQASLKAAIRRANKALPEGIEPISERVSPHSLRRSFASIRFEAGEQNPAYIMQQLGHVSAQFSLEVYTRAQNRKLAGEAKRAAAWTKQWARLVTIEPEPAEGIPAIPHRQRDSDTQRA